jgi:hypothetical protein
MSAALKIERRGRKRKFGKRHPNGKLVQEKPVDQNVIALRMPHRAGVPQAVAHDPKAESSLGRYNLNGVITSKEYDAGVYYRGVVARYLMLIKAPQPNMRSCTGEATSRGMPLAIDSDEAERRQFAYNEAYEAIEEAGGQRGAKAVSRVAIYDCACPDGMIGPMRYALVGLMLKRGLCTKSEALDMRDKIKATYRNIR